MTQNVRAASAAFLLMVLAACAAFLPKTPEQVLASAYASHAALSKTTTLRLEAGAITPADAAEVSAKLHEALGIIEQAEALYVTTGSWDDAKPLLDRFQTSLSYIEGLLAEREKVKRLTGNAPVTEGT